MNIIFFNYK